MGVGEDAHHVRRGPLVGKYALHELVRSAAINATAAMALGCDRQGDGAAGPLAAT